MGIIKPPNFKDKRAAVLYGCLAAAIFLLGFLLVGALLVVSRLLI